jgi:hypothetical protein
LSNFIPGAGIWLNTQRPEWNDANNALVGNGASMVTLYYLRRALLFWEDIFNNNPFDEVNVSEEVVELFDSLNSFLKEHQSHLVKGFSDTDRKKFADFFGHAHWNYRKKIYNYLFSGEKKSLKADQLATFTRIALQYIDQTISVNKRQDGLYHAYNLLTISDNQISVRHLYEMLEGQVAILSSGYLSPAESLRVLDSLKSSKMFREDQYSYLLYPDRELPRFNEKNIIPSEAINNSSLLGELIADDDSSIIRVDDDGICHFNASFRNATVLEQALDELRVGKYNRLVEEEKDKILTIYEEIFDHQSFTGRSGTFYGYEGLGSIYWHMVSKLLLAVQESYFNALDEGADQTITGKLKDYYFEIKAGVGLYKSPDLYGAFPMDAYSHTPANQGVKQPGLTGQVKEDVISRLGEMGIRIKNGLVYFDPALTNREEVLNSDATFEYYSLDDEWVNVNLNKGQWAVTFCQVPIIFSEATENKINLLLNNGRLYTIQGTSLDKDASVKLFQRSGDIKKIDVCFKKDQTNG